jgi:two-component system, chemotaxis family, chemotaxis protein CheY
MEGLMNALVLVVEDDTLLRQTIADVLEIEGYEVECAGDGREALAFLQNGTQPCLIVLDLTMPEMDGWEFRRRQKANTVLARSHLINR